MADIDETVHRLNKKTLDLFQNFPLKCQETYSWLKNFQTEIQKQMLEIDDYNKPLFPKTPITKHQGTKRPAILSSSDDEVPLSNITKIHDTVNITNSILTTTEKPRRNASKVASMKINKQTQITLKSKMRRPRESDSTRKEVKVKIEKKSVLAIEKTPSILADTTNTMDMPPPAAKPKRTRKKIKKEVDSSDTENECIRVTRSKRTTKKESTTTTDEPSEAKTSSTTRQMNSDVFIQEVPATVFVVADSDSETDAKNTPTTAEESPSTEELPTKEIDKPTNTDDEEVIKPTKGKKKIKKVTNKLKPKENEIETEKSVLPVNNESQEVSLYEDAVSEHDKIVEAIKAKEIPIENVKETGINIETLNVTHVIQKDSDTQSPLLLNSTRVIEKPVLSPAIEKIIKEKGVSMNCTVVLQNINETFTVNPNTTKILTPHELPSAWQKSIPVVTPKKLLTDDDDSIDVSFGKKTPAKNAADTKKGIKTKPMFSPYANSPVKKRVAAFEKLGATPQATSDVPVRVTRTKTRNMNAEKENQQKAATAEPTRIPSAKPKYVTPISNNKCPSMIPHTEGKLHRQHNKYNCSTLSSDISVVKSALKPSRVELQERREEEQKKKLEREDQVKRKKEAMLQAKAEEQRRKREEKQMRAQKTREAKEREKDEKLRQMIQEKDEKQQQEEQNKREWLAKKAMEAELRKKAEEQSRLLKLEDQARMLKAQERLRQQEERKKKLKQKPPALPTDDCEDSDDENTNKQKYYPPLWAQKHNLHSVLRAQRYIPDYFSQELFQMQATTPDLREIFDIIDERILKRNSSAVWRTPPRYSTLPKF